MTQRAQQTLRMHVHTDMKVIYDIEDTVNAVTSAHGRHVQTQQS